MSNLKFDFHKVGQDRWDDLAVLFEGRGGPKNCWCMAWRKMPPEAKRGDRGGGKLALKAALCSRAASGTPIGILGYHSGTPAAWCSIAPRSTYRPLGGPEDPVECSDVIWSVVCFYVRTEFQGQGIIDQLLEAAIAYARHQGANIIEAYPVDPDSPSYRFMGFVSVFERAGFKKVGTAGIRRHVMRLKID